MFYVGTHWIRYTAIALSILSFFFFVAIVVDHGGIPNGDELFIIGSIIVSLLNILYLTSSKYLRTTTLFYYMERLKVEEEIRIRELERKLTEG